MSNAPGMTGFVLLKVAVTPLLISLNVVAVPSAKSSKL